ncbi:unnamed protein product [Durusdinium trenchii]|uniref:Major facilitator superfamily (MFS) profile domain-containing protein n=1 Tax=Durusdinium trenchii TaxID=1381693 RepID=A0ABP0M433_9DINO
MTQHAVPPNGEPALVSSRNFILRLVLPGLLQGKAQTFVQPMLPIFVAVDLGGSHGMVGLIASCYPIAQFLGSTPVGFVMKHLENSLAACLALAWMVTTALLSFAAQTVYVLMCIRLLGGLGATSFDISQKAWSFLQVFCLPRGRDVGKTFAPVHFLVRPRIAALLSGVVAQHLATRSIFLVQASLSFCALLLIALHSLYLRRKSADVELQDSGAAAPQDVSLRAIVRDHWRGLLGAGHHIGLSKMGIGASVAWYRGCDAAVTTAVAGYIMDNYGLKASAVPSMLLMSAAFSLLAIVQGPISLALVALVFGVGNGMCGGVINAFAASLTPPHARTQFLGLWKTVTSLGGICVPPIFGLVSDSSTLDMAGFCISGAALCTALWTVLMVQQVVPSRRAGPSPAQGDQVSVSLANNPSPA